MNILSIAQNQNSVWCFGHYAGIDFKNIASPQTFTSPIISRGTACSVSDSSGNLLFSAAYDTMVLYVFLEGGKVYDKFGNIMQNGDSMAGDGWYQNMVIVHDPANENLYYLFSIGVTSFTGLYYSTIDMNQNGGLGVVMQKNVQLNNLTANDCVTAIKHGNGRDWWLFFRHSDLVIPNNDFYIYLIDPTGIHPAWIQNSGPLNYGNNGGTIEFNKSGTQFSFTAIVSQLELFDFDRCTGIITHNTTIEPQSINGPYKNYQWSAFSPSGRYLYMSEFDTISRLYQYDLLAPNITASKILIDSFIFPQYCAGKLKLAPDDKIYMTNAYNDGINFNYPYPDTTYNMYNMNLSVINQPDSPGLACNFTKYSFYLGGNRTYWGLPNNPDYTLAPVAGSVCDTLGLSVIELSKLKFKLLVNPVTDIVQFTSSEKISIAIIVDMLGKKIMQVDFKNNNEIYSVSVTGLKQGMYFLQVETPDKRKGVRKFVKQ